MNQIEGLSSSLRVMSTTALNTLSNIIDVISAMADVCSPPHVPKFVACQHKPWL